MCMATNFTLSQRSQGFALLMSLIVVSVVISIGLTVLDLSIKQVRLATNARDSETSFHAANAGVECGRYTRRINTAQMEAGQAITPSCFGATVSDNARSTVSSTGNGQVYRYTYNLSWGGASEPRCSEVITMVAVATAPGSGLTVNNMNTHVPGFTSNTWTCAAGERCTALSVRGYNRACAASYGFGTVEREVLLQF